MVKKFCNFLLQFDVEIMLRMCYFIYYYNAENETWLK